MSPLLPLASVVLATVAVLLALRAQGTTIPRVSRRLNHISDYQGLGRTERGLALESETPARIRGAGLFDVVGQHVLPRLGVARVEVLRAKLRSAGMYSFAPETFFGAQAALTLGGVAFAFWVGAAKGLAVPVVVLFALFAGYVGFAVPLTLVSRRARLRIESIDRQMPELVDLLVVAIEAGLGLGAALDRAATRMTGALAAELRLVLQEQGLGATSAEALAHLVERSDTPAVRTFVRTLVQGDRLGVPIGQTMRAIATDMRKRRRATAEAKAQRAPVKILFPLVFCIFPALLIIILAPAGISIVHGLSHG